MKTRRIFKTEGQRMISDQAAGLGKSYQRMLGIVARKCGLAPSTLNRYLRQGCPNDGRAAIIAHHVGCSIHALLHPLTWGGKVRN